MQLQKYFKGEDCMDKLKLLYVDDEEVNLSNFKMVMKRHFKVITALSAQEALDRFDEHGDIALVVTDQRMPGQTGTELLAEIRQRLQQTFEDYVRAEEALWKQLDVR